MRLPEQDSHCGIPSSLILKIKFRKSSSENGGHCFCFVMHVLLLVSDDNLQYRDRFLGIIKLPVYTIT